MSIDMSGKVVLVAGGTGGLGRAVSLAFLNVDATVVTTSRKAAALEALKREAGARVGSLDTVVGNMTDGQEAAALVEGIRKRHGRLDVVVNCIGAYAGGLKVWEMDLAVFDRMLQLNLRSGFLLARATMPTLLEQEHGAFINIAAKAAVDHAAGAAAYAASKAGAVAMVDSLAADVKGSGVRVNTILPSIIDTAVNRQAMPGAAFEKWPKPEEIARVILFLASSGGRVIHGAAIPVYGDS